jgi:nitroreductase
MEIIELIKKRRSTRKFSDKKVSLDQIKKLIELANMSPSAGNLQARSIVIVQDQSVIEKIKEVAGGLSKFETKIPVILVILAKPEESAVRYEDRGRNLYSLQDATIFASYFQLLATEKGLATCWVGYFNEKDIAKILNLPNDVRPVAMLPIGYPAENPEPKDRKTLDKLILKEV